MAVIFSKKYYNPLYFILNSVLKDTTIRTVLIYGGKSSSKTISICQVLAKEAYINLVNSIAFRKQSAIIPTTLKKSFNLAIDSQYLYPAFSKQDRRYLCIGQNGDQSEIVLRGLDDPEKAKGIESYKYVYLDELNHFEQSEYDQFNLSLRGIEGQKIIASWNPTDELSWVKTKLIDSYTFVKSDKYELPNPDSFVHISTDGKCILIKTNYLDNYWIVGSPDGSYGYKDINLMSEYYDLQFKNPMSYRVNVLGEWGKVIFGGEFLKDFNSDKHVKLLQYNPELPLHIVFDENVNPYITMLVWQIDGFNAYQIDELCLVDPYNRRHHLCNEFKKRYPVHLVKGLFVYGDRTSKKEDTAKEKGENFYTDVFKYLVDYRPVLRLQSVNPSVVQSGGFINQIFSGNQNVTIAISSRCTTSIYDYEHTLEDSDGTMKKSKKKNPITGVTYEEHGHCFTGDTLITTSIGQVRIDQITVGQLVLTRDGYKPVVKVFDNGIQKIKKYKIGSIAISCTPEHKFWVDNNFIHVDLIRKGICCIFDEQKQKICYQNLLFTEESISGDTLNRKTENADCTILDGLARKRSDSMCTNMNVKSEKLKKVCTSIIRMKILLIMKLQTLKRSLLLFMQGLITIVSLTLKSKRELRILSRMLYLPQKHGIHHRRGCYGTVNTPESLSSESKEVLSVQTVGQNLSRHLSVKNIVQLSAIINTRQDDYENVYDLMVEDKHEYFANNILVHNCLDAMRYLITKAFEKEYLHYTGRKKRGIKKRN